VHLIPSQNDMPCKRFNINIPINSAWASGVPGKNSKSFWACHEPTYSHYL
jgi:hypothetical protein